MSFADPVTSPWNRRSTALLTIALVLAAVAFISTLQFQFVYDDESQIVGNQLIEQWRFVPHYFNIQVWAHVNPHISGNYYRPIFMVWMRLNQALFGYRPWGWHLTTVLMHVLATFFVFKLARRLSQRDDVAFIAAVIFGVHPAHIEAVAWVSGVTEPLFAALLIPSFLWFLDWRDGRPNARAYSLLLYTLAIFSKETAVLMMPLVFAYCWIYPRPEKPSLIQRFTRSLLPALPFLAITIGYLYLRKLALGKLFFQNYPIGLKNDVLTIPSVSWLYVKMLFAPVGLAAFYDTPYITSPTLRGFLLPLLGVLLLAFAIFLWWWKTRDRLVAFSAILLVLPFLPLLNLGIFFEGEIAHDRYLYIPSIGFALLLAIALTKLTSGGAKQVLGVEVRAAAITAVVAVGLLSLTIYQSLFWSDDLVLYNRGVQIAPNNNLALNNLANEFEKRHMYPQALTLYSRVLERKPNFYLSNFNVGYVFFETGQYEPAERFLRRAAALDPTDASTFYYMAQCEMHLGQLAEAETNFHRAIATDQRLLGPRYMLGVLLKKQGRNKEALDYFRAELSKNPMDAKAKAEVEALTAR